MALLLRDREATPDAPAPSPGADLQVAVPDFACEACGAAMERGQDWCLECGRAAAGRLGARPGWRAAFTVVAVTLLLVCAAVVASYAALTTKAERSAAAPSAATGQPIIAGTPPVAPAPGAPIQPDGETGPGTTPPPAITPPAAGVPTPVIPVPVPQPVTPPANTPVTPAPTTGAQAPETPTLPSTPQLVPFKADAAATYDPGKRAGAEFGPAKNAIDAKPDTVWDVVVPADGQPLGVGLLLKLGAPLALHSLRIGTPTPGFRVELYGAVDDSELPTDVIDKRWIHLTDRKDVVDGAPITLKGKGDGARFKVFLLYFTRAADATDPRIAVGDVKLRATL